MSSKKVEKIVHLKDLKNFRKNHLSFQQRIDCEKIHSSDDVYVNTGFLEIIKIEDLKVGMDSDHITVESRSFFSIILLTQGQVKITIGTHSINVEAPSVCFVSENQLYKMHPISDDVKGYQLIFDENYYSLSLRNQSKLNDFFYFLTNVVPVAEINPLEMKEFLQIVNKIEKDYCVSTSSYNDLLVRLYLNILLLEIEKHFNTQSEGLQIQNTTHASLVTQFRKLLKQNYISKRKVVDYADMLNVSAHYLNSIVRKQTGSNVRSEINEQVLLAAKSFVLQTDLSFSQIALELRFSSLGHFSRFFKNNTGLSPLKFRNLHK